jgi:hypothetical protein
MWHFWHNALQFLANVSTTETHFQLNVGVDINTGHVVLAAYDYTLKE